MFTEVITITSENEVDFVDKSNVSDNIFDAMDYEIDSIMRVIDNRSK